MKTKILFISLFLSSLFLPASAQNGRIHDECNAGITPTWFGNTKIVWGENSTWNLRNGDVYRYALDNINNWAYMVYEVPTGASVSKMIVDFYSPSASKPTLAVKDIAGKETKYVQGWNNGMPTEISMGENLYRYVLPKEIIPDGQFQGCVYIDAKSDVEILRVVTEYGSGYVKVDDNLNADFSRLENLLAKAEAKKNITIAVIGGSITAGANSEPIANFPNCYGARVKHYLETKYNIVVNLINAGIGSTNSYFGNIRAEEHFLKYNPDLVIMEYAVNDLGDTESLICYEGLIRKVLKAPGHPALVATMMCTQAGISHADAQVQIAQHYNVPIINYNIAIKDEIIEGTKTWTDYYGISTNINGDGVHPNTTGHQKVADMFAVICDALTPNDTDVNTTLPSPKYSDMMENAFFVNEKDVMPKKIGSWTDGGKIWDFKTGNGWYSEQAESELVFDFTGDVVAVTYWKRPVGENFGRAEIWVDDEQSVIVDGSNGEYITQQILSGFDNGAHKLHIKLLDNKKFEIICVAFSGNRDFFNMTERSITSKQYPNLEYCFVDKIVRLMQKGLPFTTNYTDDGYLTLKNGDNYISVENETGILVESTSLSDNTKFLFVDKGIGFALRSVSNGKYISVKTNGTTHPLVADASSVSDAEIFSISEFVSGPITSVDDIKKNDYSLYAKNGTLYIENGTDKSVTIYSLAGSVIYKNNSIDSNLLSISLLKGIYLVAINEQGYKIAL